MRSMTDHNASHTKFFALLQEQIRHEFTAEKQCIAIATYFDAADLPHLAKYFYRKGLEERNHAMMMVRYFIDRDVRVEIPGCDEVRNEFDTPRAAVALALDWERTVTRHINELAATARAEGDYLGEQFIWWFLKEQVEEEAEMTTLLRVTERAGDKLFDLDEFVRRDFAAPAPDSGAPPAAGGRG